MSTGVTETRACDDGRAGSKSAHNKFSGHGDDEVNLLPPTTRGFDTAAQTAFLPLGGAR